MSHEGLYRGVEESGLDRLVSAIFSQQRVVVSTNDGGRGLGFETPLRILRKSFLFFMIGCFFRKQHAKSQ